MRLLQLKFGQRVHHFWDLEGFGMHEALTDADVLVEPPQPLGGINQHLTLRFMP